MALLGLLVLLALAGPVVATWDTCRGTCGLRPMVLNESSTVPEYGSSDSAKGGTNLDVPPGAWPGIASVQVTMENGTWHMCSGALISHCWVLTAASCFSGAGAVQEWKVVIGATNLAEPGPEAEVFQVKRILVHHGYVAATATNNIALLELEQPVECSDYIQLGCVPDSSLAVPELKTCYMAGWRASPGSGHPRLVLQEAKVRLMDVQLCNSSRWYGGAVHPQDLCAGYPRGGIDTCQGDIGGPLVCKDIVGDYFWLVGLASWGQGCASARRPGVFTSTQHFHGWIRAHTGPSPAAPTAAPRRSLNAPGEQPGVISFPKSALRRFLETLQELLEQLKDRTG
ncbi:acrosin-like [Acridotheres tristis]